MDGHDLMVGGPAAKRGGTASYVVSTAVEGLPVITGLSPQAAAGMSQRHGALTSSLGLQDVMFGGQLVMQMPAAMTNARLPGLQTRYNSYRVGTDARGGVTPPRGHSRTSSFYRVGGTVPTYTVPALSPSSYFYVDPVTLQPVSSGAVRHATIQQHPRAWVISPHHSAMSAPRTAVTSTIAERMAAPIASQPQRKGMTTPSSNRSSCHSRSMNISRLTYSQCEIIPTADNSSHEMTREPSEEKSRVPSPKVTNIQESPGAATSVRYGHRAYAPKMLSEVSQAVSVTDMTPIGSPQSKDGEDKGSDPPRSSEADDPSVTGWREDVTLEELKRRNEESLKLARNEHVKDIWKTLRDPPPVTASMPGQSPNTTGTNVQFTDVEQAKKVLQHLNPSVKDTDKLLQTLIDHISGKQFQLDPSMFRPESLKQLLLPVAEGGELQAKASAGFKASHSFAMKWSNGEVHEFVCARVIESPEVLAVSELLGLDECQDLITLSRDRFVPAKVSQMKVKVEEQVMTYDVPDDLNSLGMTPEVSAGKQNDVAVLNLSQFEGHPVSAFLKSVALRGGAMAKSPSTKIHAICVERYKAGQGAVSLHCSNKRKGMIIVGLARGKAAGGAISFPAAGLEFHARPGMALWIPSLFPDTITSGSKPLPDLRTEFAITPLSLLAEESDTLYLAVMSVDF